MMIASFAFVRLIEEFDFNKKSAKNLALSPFNVKMLVVTTSYGF